MLIKSVQCRALNNHSIIAILFAGFGTQLIDVLFYMNFARLG
ncbi:unnamed protein product, partial [Rotaria sp. Silwood1]